ncbi:MAG: M48 family metallopeptidase [Patescibacteria group bacterium]
MNVLKKIILDDQEISYSLKSYRRAKRVRLRITQEGVLIISKPYFVNQKIVENFIYEKRAWVLDKINSVKNNSNRIEVGDYLENKEKVRAYIFERLKYFSQFYNFEFNQIFVRRQKTRWGSCSVRKNLNFNYKILWLPAHLADYIIVHELCHLEQMNHSLDFWKLVGQQIPDYKERRRELRQVVF